MNAAVADPAGTEDYPCISVLEFTLKRNIGANLAMAAVLQQDEETSAEAGVLLYFCKGLIHTTMMVCADHEFCRDALDLMGSLGMEVSYSADGTYVPAANLSEVADELTDYLTRQLPNYKAQIENGTMDFLAATSLLAFAKVLEALGWDVPGYGLWQMPLAASGMTEPEFYSLREMEEEPLPGEQRIEITADGALLVDVDHDYGTPWDFLRDALADLPEGTVIRRDTDSLNLDIPVP